MHSLSIAFKDLQELKEGISKNSVVDHDKMLIQVFSAKASKEYIKIIQTFFQQNFPFASLIGSTTDGIVDGCKLYADAVSVVVFSSFEKSAIEIGVCELSQECGSYCCGESLAFQLVKKDTQAIIAFGDGLYLNGEEFVNGVSAIAPDVVLSGGLAGDNGEMKNTYVFDKEQIIERGAVAAALHSEHLHVGVKYSFDWTAL